MWRGPTAMTGPDPRWVSLPAPPGGRPLKLALHNVPETLSKGIGRRGTHEPVQTVICQRLLAPGASFIDVGANIGWYTIHAAARVGRQGRVIAVEPDPDNCRLLRASVTANGFKNVQIFEAAAAQANGQAILSKSPQNFGDHRLLADDNRQQITVRTLTLDEIDPGKVDFVKIDTQGTEAKVLAGAAGILGRDRPTILLEFWPDGLRLQDSSYFDLFAFIDRHGYEIFRVGTFGVEKTTLGVLAQVAHEQLLGSDNHIDLLLPNPKHKERLMNVLQT